MATSETESKPDQLDPGPFPRQAILLLILEGVGAYVVYTAAGVATIFLRDQLHFSEIDSIFIYHITRVIGFSMPLVGAALADNWFGKIKVTIAAYGCYSITFTLMLLASLPSFDINDRIYLYLFSKLIAALAQFGVPIAFCGDQFVLPRQQAHMAKFWMIFYFMTNIGRFFAYFMGPYLRSLHCFQESSCYFATFFQNLVMFFIIFILFVIFIPWYIKLKPNGGIIWEVMKCIWYGMRQSCKRPREQVDHWLDRSVPVYGQTMVTEIKSITQVFIIYVPLPFFWALYDQHGSGWIFQATRMNGDIGFYRILPEQTQMLTPLLIILFIPIITFLVYPYLNKYDLLTKPLQRMILGSFLAAISFLMGAGVSYWIELNVIPLPDSNDCTIRIYNPTKCSAYLTIDPYLKNASINAMSFEKFNLKNINNVNAQFSLTVCENFFENVNNTLLIRKNELILYHIVEDGNGIYSMIDDIEKAQDGSPRVRFFLNYINKNVWVKLTLDVENDLPPLELKLPNDRIHSLPLADVYNINKMKYHFDIGFYVILVNVNESKLEFEIIEVNPPNAVHMVWLIPQYTLMAVSEVLLAVTGLEFSYTQAPISMKSIMTAVYTLTLALGNVLVIAIQAIMWTDLYSVTFLFFAAVMLVDSVIFVLLAKFYTYYDYHHTSLS